MSGNSVSKKNLRLIFVCMLLALAGMAVALRPNAALAEDGDGRKGKIQIIKECSKYMGNVGDYCTIVSSNVSEIPSGSQVFYTRAALGANSQDPDAIEYKAISLDSNVVLHVRTGDWAVGRCTLNPDGATGLCTFSDGTGQLTGFAARVDVSPAGGAEFRWDGIYSFSSKLPK